MVGVNDWDDDELVINNSGDSAEDLPLVRDKYGCPGLQVQPPLLSLLLENPAEAHPMQQKECLQAAAVAV